MAKPARKKSTRKTTKSGAKPRATHPTDPKAALREALLRLTAAGGWRDLSYAEIAQEAGVSLSAAYEAYPSKAAILVGIGRDIDARIFAGLARDPLEGSPKDRLFDLLMRRFDALNQHREAYAALARDLPRTPGEGLALLCQLRSSLARMLEAAGISASGLRGALRVEGTGAIYAAAMRVWFRDETSDLSKTMAELDKRLSQAERCIEMTRRKTT
jgi:ubiquinone biosynthesis protein COQ9